ncbi:helix-turn-helix domain-containing protein [Streptomyces sp. NPDC051976]|uniref:helix-turn-helix domain-containing protein n=1 Tax=Streptomyces sp. NPDC051976 TaxID=3154947 RepID=UPI0034484F8C
MSVPFAWQSAVGTGSPGREVRAGRLTDRRRENYAGVVAAPAVERFESGQKNAEVAAALRISVRSVERWRRAWREGGGAGVLLMGSPGRRCLGPVSHGLRR